MEQAYARQYAELYRRHWWWRAREHLIVDVLTHLRPAVRWGTILDVGCGDGLFFDRATQFGEVEGVEPDASLVSPEGPYRARIHIGPFDESFQPRKRYSLVLMLDVLEHLADPAAALRHAASLLAPDGILLVTVPAFNLVWTNHDELNRHLTRYTRATLRRLADAVGLRVTHMWYFFHSLFLAKLAVRLWEAVLPRSPAPPGLPPRWINGALYALARGEQRLLGRLSLPFGSSLMLIARPGTATLPRTLSNSRVGGDRGTQR